MDYDFGVVTTMTVTVLLRFDILICFPKISYLQEALPSIKDQDLVGVSNSSLLHLL
jgi:hypothetical protein